MNADIVAGRPPGRVDRLLDADEMSIAAPGGQNVWAVFLARQIGQRAKRRRPKRHGFGAGLAVGKYQAARSKLIYSHRSDGSPTDGIPENQKSDRGDPLERAEGKDLVALVPIWYLKL